MHTIWQDVRYGLRMLDKNPGFTAVAVLTLALGVGATTAIFSVVYGVLLRPLPFPHPEQIVRLWEMNEEGGRMNFADPNFEDVRSQNHSLVGVAEFGGDLESVSGANEPTRTMTTSVSRDFFRVMGVQPFLGRSFAPEVQRTQAAAVAVVSHAYWKQSLGSTQDLSSIHLKIGALSASVVGVMAPGFRFPDNTDIWIPREIFETLPSRTAHNWKVVGRLREGSSVTQSRAELSEIAQRLKRQYGQDTAMVAVAAEPLRAAMTGNMRPALIVLLSASGFLLLIACANVVNLMLAQAAGRERELSVRAALGASRDRLIRQFLTEAFLLSAFGGALGVLVALWGLNGLLAIAPGNLPRLEEVSINLPVLIFSLVAVFFVAIALGVCSAVRATSSNPVSAMNEASHRQAGGPRKRELGRLIVAGQLATALILLVGAGLLGRSLLRVLAVEPGFRTEGVVMNPAQISPHMQDLIRRAAQGSLEKDPVLLSEFSKFFDELFRDQSRLGTADYEVASGGYFRALGIPLLKGRLFDVRDTMEAPHVALISESLAKERWPNQDPLGRTMEFGNMDGDVRLLTVIGIVGDVRDRTLESAPRPTVYVNYRQRPQLGIIGSFALTRWVQSQLFGVSPTDPATFGAVALLLLLVSLAACWLPARRATRVDPVVALRYE